MCWPQLRDCIDHFYDWYNITSQGRWQYSSLTTRPQFCADEDAPPPVAPTVKVAVQGKGRPSICDIEGKREQLDPEDVIEDFYNRGKLGF
jgi:hypothetical protein